MLAYRTNPRMPDKPMHAADAAELGQIADATSFTTSLFLGRGQWDKIQGAATLADARANKAKLTGAHPECTRVPLVYAEFADGRPGVLVPDTYGGPAADDMLAKAAPAFGNPRGKGSQAYGYAKRSNAQRAARAAASNPAAREGEHFVTSKLPNGKWTWAACPAPSDKPHTPAPDAGKGAADVELTCTYPACKCIVSTSTTQPLPICPRGLVGPNSILATGLLPQTATAAEIDAAMGGAVPGINPADVFVGVKKISPRHIDMLESAKAGVLPTPPDSSPPSWAGNTYRGRLEKLVAMVAAGDVAGLEAEKLPSYDSGFVAMSRYRNLAVIALRARAARR